MYGIVSIYIYITTNVYIYIYTMYICIYSRLCKAICIDIIYN